MSSKNSKKMKKMKISNRGIGRGLAIATLGAGSLFNLGCLANGDPDPGFWVGVAAKARAVDSDANLTPEQRAILYDTGDNLQRRSIAQAGGSNLTINVNNGRGNAERVPENVIVNRDGSYRPADGYRWVNPGSQGDFSVERIAQINNVWLEQGAERNGREGIVIHTDFDVNGRKGSKIRPIAYFFDENGAKLPDHNGRYKTQDGQVSVGDDSMVTYDRATWKNYELFIPSEELDIAASGPCRLKVYVDVFEDRGGKFEWLTRSNWRSFEYKGN